MSAIMMDNWSLESATSYLGLSNEERTAYGEGYIDSWVNLITALVLWDEIWYVTDPRTLAWKAQMVNHSVLEKFDTVIHPIDKHDFDNDIMDKLIDSASSYSGESPSYIEKRTILYGLMSNVLGINVLLHSKRDELSTSSPLMSPFSRLDIFKTIDRDLQEYYEYINDKLGRKYLSFAYPVLYDFIKNQTYMRYRTASENSDIIETAFEIRQEKDVVRFRDEIEHIECLVNSGDTQALLTQLNLLDEIAKELSNKYNKSIVLADFKLSLTPSLSRTFPIEIKCNENMRIHTSFIKTIYSFGIDGRDMRDIR